MKKTPLLNIASCIVALAASPALTACDEGRIYDDYVPEGPDGLTARLTATLTGADTWSEDYTLAVAGFADGDDYARVSKNVTADDNGVVDVTMTGIPEDVNRVELCVIDRLRHRVATFAMTEVLPGRDKITVEAGNLDVSQTAAIQQEIFNTTCANCHGASNHAAGQLDLTAGHSFDDLVGVASHHNPAMMRVVAGNSAESLLYRILSTDESASWYYDHSVEVTDPVKIDLVKDWIDNGARH